MRTDGVVDAFELASLFELIEQFPQIAISQVSRSPTE